MHKDFPDIAPEDLGSAARHVPQAGQRHISRDEIPQGTLVRDLQQLNDQYHPTYVYIYMYIYIYVHICT